MKLRSLPVSNENIVLLGALGLIALNTLPKIAVQNEDVSSVFELSEDGEPISVARKPQNDYIQKATKLMTMNDYGVIKTLYKLQSVLDDINFYSSSAANIAAESSSDLMDVLYSVEPYLAQSKRNKFQSITSNIDKTKSTIEKFVKMKQKINNAPGGSSRFDRIKSLVSEIPNLTGIPLLENMASIKNIASFLKPLAEASKGSAPQTEEEEYKQIYDLVDLIDSQKD